MGDISLSSCHLHQNHVIAVSAAKFDLSPSGDRIEFYHPVETKLNKITDLQACNFIKN